MSQRRPPGSSESGAYQAGPSRGVTAGVAHANNRFVRAPPGSPTRSETVRRAGGSSPKSFNRESLRSRASEPEVSRASAKRGPRVRTTTPAATVFRPRRSDSVIPVGSAPESAVATKSRLSWALTSEAGSGRGSAQALATHDESRSTAPAMTAAVRARRAASGWTHFPGVIGP